MSEMIDRTELVARRLARYDGLDPDALGIPAGWEMYKGTYATQLPSNPLRVWQLYLSVAEAAIEAVDQHAVDMKRFAAEQERAEPLGGSPPTKAHKTRPALRPPSNRANSIIQHRRGKDIGATWTESKAGQARAERTRVAQAG